ncbi:hypothetical protein MASR2M64_09110 [Candidatus Cloacimonadota bacterium]
MNASGKPTLKINFVDFWKNLDKLDNYFSRLLCERYELVISDNPEVLFYSMFGKKHLNYKCKRIFYSGENAGADFSECDFALTSDYNADPRHYRLPLYLLYFSPERFVKPEFDAEAELDAKKGFCSFVVSNSGGKVRNRFYEKLSRYKAIASGGKYRNNIGYRVPDKLAFIRDYRFCLSFENKSYPGYTTEKLVEALFANTVPIYWGNPIVQKEFNPDAFLCYHDYPSEKAFINRIIEVESNKELYLSYLKAPWCRNNSLAEQYQPDSIREWLCQAIATSITPIACKPRSIMHIIEHQHIRFKNKTRRGNW